MKETQWNEKAKAAMDKEWNRLKSIKTWSEDTVMSKREAEKKAKQSGQTYHFGRVFPILVEKNSELDEKDERRKFKGRVVFDGSDVRDQDRNVALFQELSSSPATMEAGKAADAYGMLPGHSIEQADAVQAYTQATLKGTKTYVSLPKEAWPDWWHDLPYDDPVCELRLALYGHPDSGGFWEKHCDDFLTAVGFEKIDSWGSCYFHPRHKTFLIVYVDDFKMAGPTDSLKECWALIQSPVAGKESLKIEPPEPVNRFLGCQHRLTTKHVTWHGGDPTDLDPTIQQRIDEKRQKKAALREVKEAARKAVPAETLPRVGAGDASNGGRLPSASSPLDGGTACPARQFSKDKGADTVTVPMSTYEDAGDASNRERLPSASSPLDGEAVRPDGVLHAELGEKVPPGNLPVDEGAGDTLDGERLPSASFPSNGPAACPAKISPVYPWKSEEWKTQRKTAVQAIEYDMEEFFMSCVQRYADMTGTDPSTYPRVPTPFGVEDVNLEDGLDGPTGQQAGISAAMEGLQNLVEGADAEGATKTTSDKDKPGLLGPIAAQVLMKILYGARMARYDLLRAVCHLASCVTKWNRQCDVDMYRLICYIQTTLSFRQYSWVGDDAS
jgi:hypothetical protein